MYAFQLRGEKNRASLQLSLPANLRGSYGENEFEPALSKALRTYLPPFAEGSFETSRSETVSPSNW
jgi:hypothetical protein